MDAIVANCSPVRLRAFILLILLTPAAAQVGNPVVYGTAVDESGKPYVGATVKLINTETGARYSAKTGKDGSFRMIASVGIYVADLIVNGQQEWERRNVEVFS